MAYGRCLELAKQGNNANIAMTLNNLANLDHDQNRMGAARKEYEEALKIHATWRKTTPILTSPM